MYLLLFVAATVVLLVVLVARKLAVRETRISQHQRGYLSWEAGTRRPGRMSSFGSGTRVRLHGEEPIPPRRAT